MKKWNVYIQANGDGISRFKKRGFEISDELYGKIQEAVKNDIPLFRCDFYRELCERAKDSVDWAEFYGLDVDRPDRDDYDSEDDYREALDDYNGSLERATDEYSLEDFTVEDPGEFNRFCDRFIGRFFPDYAYEHDEEFEFEEDGERCARFTFTVSFDEKGKITDIGEVCGEGLEWESERSSSYGECRPDYDYLADELEDCLGEETESTDWYDYSDFPFAMEVVNGEIISLTEDFQVKIRERILERLGITEGELAAYLTGVSDDDGPDDDDRFDMLRDDNGDGEFVSEILGFNEDYGTFSPCGIGFLESESGWQARDLLKNLGFVLSESIEYGPHGHGTNGVVFVREEDAK